MNVFGKVKKKDGKWMLDGRDGNEYELVGGDIPDKMEGLTVRVVGTTEDAFGMGMFNEGLPLNVQKINVV